MWCEHSILTLATFTGVHETSLALKVPKSFGFKGTRGHNPKALKPRPASVSLSAHAAFKHPLGMTSQLGWLKTNKAKLKSLVPIHWDTKTDHYHEPSCLGKHFFEFHFTSIFDFIQTTSPEVTSSENHSSAKIPNSIRSGIKLDLKKLVVVVFFRILPLNVKSNISSDFGFWCSDPPCKNN